MNRPNSIPVYDDLDLKLGIKSSLPNVKSTIALMILLWEIADRPAKLAYSKQEDKSIILTEELQSKIYDTLAKEYKLFDKDNKDIVAAINNNQLFKSQLEALIVAFELVWKLAKIGFVDTNKAASAERTGGVRYPKVLYYTSNMDIIHLLIESDYNGYFGVLLRWMGIDLPYLPHQEERLLKLLTVLSEGAIFKLVDKNSNILFNQNSIYKKLMETDDSVDINGDKEAKGSLRILKSLLSDSMNPYLTYSPNEGVTKNLCNECNLKDYQRRVDMFLKLSATKVVRPEYLDESLNISEEDVNILLDMDTHRLTGANNILYYGVPGSGKSYRVDEECKAKNISEKCMRRVVFHPDYTYSDFVGQILPTIEQKEDGSKGKLCYKFIPGPFTQILKTAYNNPTEHCCLIIEELNRGNAPAIFGEIFQLLDRDADGNSKYGIFNADIAAEVFGEETKQIRIPSNLDIIATMNTSDQNVFVMDTAFQRRWKMRYIKNRFEGEQADKRIVGSNITWKAFAETANDIISHNSFGMGSTEDKGLGAYFAIGKELEEKDSFSEKVLKYLWDDAVKLSREQLFRKDLCSLPTMFDEFENGGLASVLKEEVYNAMVTASNNQLKQDDGSTDKGNVEG